MRYSNCLIGLFVLMFRLRQCKRIITVWTKGQWVPHFMLLANDGWFYHYKLVRDILPHPLCYLAFEGQFVRQKTAGRSEYEVLSVW